jgi:hypothetical protein
MTEPTPELERFKVALDAKPCPPSGTGCHAWLFWAACTAVEGGFNEEDVGQLIEDAMSRAPEPAGEIEDAFRSARREERDPAMKWPPRDFKTVEKVLAGAEWSPERPNAAAAPTLRLLFPGDPLLCIGKTSSDFATGHLSDFKFLDRNSLIVPSPMTAKEGKTKAGHMSAHSLDNTGPRHYLICEADWGSLEGQLKLLRRLADYCAPGLLVAVVHSGSKSAHGWFDFRGIPEGKVLRFFQYAVSLGFDPRTYLRSQFVRLPGGYRSDKNTRQEILFLADKHLRNAKT